jgi:hypothetical protein
MKLPREERETTITFNEEADLAFVWSASPKFQRAMAKLGLEPYSKKSIEGGLGVGCYYNVPKSYVTIKLPRKKLTLTAEQRKARGEAIRVRFKKGDSV